MSTSNKDSVLSIATTRFGTVEVPASTVIEILSGIIGFPGITRYVLLDYNPPFSWLQAVEQPDLAFVVVNGAEFGEHYNFKIPDNDPVLDLKPDDDYSIINLVSVRPPPLDTTVNLKAPLIVNTRNRKGIQIVLDDQKFPMRFPLWEKPAAENK